MKKPLKRKIRANRAYREKGNIRNKSEQNK